MKSYPKVPRATSDDGQRVLNKKVYVVEKMDGANFRFTAGKNVDGVADDRLCFGSKNIVWKNRKDRDKNFDHAVNYVEERTSPAELAGLEKEGDELTVFAEAMHCHTLEYGEHEDTGGAPAFENVPNVLVFDVYSEKEGWLGWTDVKITARKLGLDAVPEVYTEARDYKSVDELPSELESQYGDGIAEGVVVRRPAPGDKLFRAKHRTQEFLDRHASAKRGSADKSRPDDTADLVYKILSKDNWVEKEIHRRENAGKPVEMSEMEEIWRDVFDDIVEEEYETILLGNWDINTKDFRSMIASRTAEKVQAYQRRPEESVLNQK